MVNDNCATRNRMTVPSKSGRAWSTSLRNALTKSKWQVIIAAATFTLALSSFVALQRWDLIAVSCGLGLIMLAIAIEDARRFIVPDVLSLPAIPLGLIVAGGLSPPDIVWQTILTHISAMVIAGGGLFLVRVVYRRMRGYDGLGLGDVKLAAVGGAWTGLQGISLFLLVACIGATTLVLITKWRNPDSINRHTPLPFGAFLAPAIWLVWLGQSIGAH